MPTPSGNNSCHNSRQGIAAKGRQDYFPGVGEARNTMQYLRDNQLDRLIKELKQPVLGICLGMQLMCKHSEEGNVDCLGIFDAEVKRFQPLKHEDKIPHMDGIQFHIPIVICSGGSTAKNMSTSYIVTTFL